MRYLGLIKPFPLFYDLPDAEHNLLEREYPGTEKRNSGTGTLALLP